MKILMILFFPCVVLIFSLSSDCQAQNGQLIAEIQELKKIVEQQSELIQNLRKDLQTIKSHAPLPEASASLSVEDRIGKVEQEIQALREDYSRQQLESEENLAGLSAQLRDELQTTRQQIALIAFTPQITMFGNLLGRTDDRAVASVEGDRIDDTFTFRAGEFELRAAIDPFADGFLTIPFEAETPTGPLEGDVEE